MGGLVLNENGINASEFCPCPKKLIPNLFPAGVLAVLKYCIPADCQFEAALPIRKPVKLLAGALGQNTVNRFEYWFICIAGIVCIG